MDFRRVSQDCRLRSRTATGARTIRQVRERNYAMLRRPLLLITFLVLSACASISEEECLSADWYSLGVEDGSKGYPLSRIGNYRKDCAEVGVAPDAVLYSVKVLNSVGSGYDSEVVQALEWIRDQALSDAIDFRVVNLSLGSGVGFLLEESKLAIFRRQYHLPTFPGIRDLVSLEY